MTEPSRTASSSYGRWYWVALTATTIALVAGAGWSGQKFHRHNRFPIVTGQSGSTIVYNHIGDNAKISTWDWTTNVRREFSSIAPHGQWGYLARDGSRVAILADNKQSMVICDLKPPHAKRVISLPRLNGPQHKGPHLFGDAIGLVAKGRYFVFGISERDLSTNTFAYQTYIRVVDTQTGLLADEYVSPVTNTYQDFQLSQLGETFDAITHGTTPDSYEGTTVRWQVSDEGKLSQVEEIETESYGMRDRVLQDDGTLRLLNSDERDSVEPSRVYLSERMFTTPRSTIWLLCKEISCGGRGEWTGPRALMDEATGRMTPLDSVVVFSEFFGKQAPKRTVGIPDQNALLIIDRYGDVQIFDAATGKTLAVDAPSRALRMRFGGLAICLALAAAAWLVAAERTQSLDWFVFALTIAAVSAQVSLITSAFAFPYPGYFFANFHPWQVVAGMTAAGSAVSCLIAVAWYWAWGSGWQAIRWCKGAAAWFLILTPAAFVITRWSDVFPQHLEIVRTIGFYMVIITYGMIAAGALAVVLAAPRVLGFRYGPQSESTSATMRYQVGDLVVTISGVAILLALVQFRVLEVNGPENKWVFFGSRWSLVAAVTIVALVAASICTVALATRWPRVGTLAATLIVIAAIAPVVNNHEFDLLQARMGWRFNDDTPYWGNGAFLFAAWITSVLPLWLLHRKGWRWARCLQPQSDHAAAPAAA